MNCESCGHDWFRHVDSLENMLCEDCYREPHGGPCYPWEFR